MNLIKEINFNNNLLSTGIKSMKLEQSTGEVAEVPGSPHVIERIGHESINCINIFGKKLGKLLWGINSPLMDKKAKLCVIFQESYF